MTVVVFGSINLDLIFNLPNIPFSGQTVLGPVVRMEPGGKGANQAVAAARDGANVMMVGAVGHDTLSNEALRLLRADGVNLDRVQAVDASTGCAAIMVDPDGQNAIAVGSGANMFAAATQLGSLLTNRKMTLVLQMELPATETAAAIAHAKAGGVRIVLNLAPAAALPEQAMRDVDLLVVNETEAKWLAEHLACLGSAAALHRRLGGVTVALTRGRDGVDVASRSGLWHQPAVVVEAVDTTAAGDCFVGVLAHRLDRGEPLQAAVQRATIAAAVCCTRPGSQGSLPSAGETEALNLRSAV